MPYPARGAGAAAVGVCDVDSCVGDGADDDDDFLICSGAFTTGLHGRGRWFTWNHAATERHRVLASDASEKYNNGVAWCVADVVIADDGGNFALVEARPRPIE